MIEIITPKERRRRATRAFDHVVALGMFDGMGRGSRIPVGRILEHVSPEIRKDARLLRSEDLAALRFMQ